MMISPRRTPMAGPWGLALVALLSFSSAAAAQTLHRGEISGAVFDPSGAVVSDLAVRLVHVDTGLERVVHTDETGRYTALLLPVGRYRIRAHGDSLASAWHDVRLRLGDAISLNLLVTVTGLTHTVEVSAVRPSTSPVVSTVVGGERIDELPTRGRDYREFALLAPTAQPITGTRGTLRLAGQPGDYLALLVDGADFTNGFFGEFTGSLETRNVTIPMEAVEEFQVAAASLRAEHGRSNGGLVQVVTKSGTNTHRGSLAYHLRHHRLTAVDAFGNAPDGLVRHQAGGGGGGPVARNRTFYFLASELQSQDTPLTVRFSRDVRGIAVPELGIANLADLEGQFPREERLVAAFGRLDHALGPAHRLTSRLNFTRNSGRRMGGGSLIVPRAIANLESFSNTGLSWLVSSSMAGPRLSLETKVQISYEDRPRLPEGEGPQVQIADTGQFGASSVLPVTQEMSRYHAAQHATYVTGRHALQAGADYNGFRLQNSSFALARHGVYTFPTLERFLTRQPSVYGQFFGLDGRDAAEAAHIDSMWQHEIAFYVQDQFRPTSRLALTVGLRYDAQFNPQPKFGTAGSLVPVGEPQRTGSAVDVRYAPVPQGIPHDTNNVGPRLDATYDLSGTGATVASLTAGYYYGRTPMIYFPLRGSGVASSTIFGPPSQFGVTFPAVLPGTISTGGPLEQLIPKPSIHYVDPGFQNPRVFNASTSLTHHLGQRWTAGATYIFSDSRNLRVGGFRSTFWDRNLAPPSSFDEFGRGLVSLVERPDSSIGQANALASFGRGRYQAMLLRVAKPVGRFVRFNAAYTLASSKGNASTERDTEASFGPSDPFNLDADYGYNELDVRHALTAHLVATLPWKLSVGTIWTANSGLAFPVYGAADANGDGVQNNGLHPDRPPVDGRLLPRFPFHQPRVSTVDVRVARASRVGPGTWQVMLDVFNVLNADNLFSEPRTNAIFGSPNFRVLNRTHGSRMAQLGVRFEF